MNPRRFGFGPSRSNLLLKHRMSVNEAMRAGGYGTALLRGDMRYVDLNAVEQAEGVTFTVERLALASTATPAGC
jgi:hypothetical protein